MDFLDIPAQKEYTYTYEDGGTISYEYDPEERITKVTDSVDGVTEYTYDALGQLLTETVNGVVVNSMTYDNYGNILTKNGKVTPTAILFGRISLPHLTVRQLPTMHRATLFPISIML